jgi:hypothetical protein
MGTVVVTQWHSSGTAAVISLPIQRLRQRRKRPTILCKNRPPKSPQFVHDRRPLLKTSVTTTSVVSIILTPFKRRKKIYKWLRRFDGIVQLHDRSDGNLKAMHQSVAWYKQQFIYLLLKFIWSRIYSTFYTREHAHWCKRGPFWACGNWNTIVHTWAFTSGKMFGHNNWYWLSFALKLFYYFFRSKRTENSHRLDAFPSF